MSDMKKFLKEGAIQVTSGGSAGFVEVCIMHPLDLVKTRLQLQPKGLSKNDPHYYHGIIDCIRKMILYEGPASLYKGILPPIVAETPKRAIKFFTFEQYKKFFMFGSPTPTPLTFVLSGLGAGITEAVFVNPFEVVKVTLQSNRSQTKVPSSWEITKKIVAKQGLGLKGLNKGLTATMARNGGFNMMYLGFYNSVKGILPEYKDPYLEFIRKVFIGFLAGTMGSTLVIPFDVAKSRIQGPQPVQGQIKYQSTIQSIMLVYKEEGFRALGGGLLPKIMRLGPGGAILLVVYEYIYNYLKKEFP